MSFWNKIVNLGVTDDMPVYKQKSTMFFNVSMRAGIIVMLLVAVTMTIIGMKYVAIGLVFGIPVAGLALALNFKGKVELSIIITSIFYPLYFIFISIFSKVHGEGQNILFFITPRVGILLLSVASFVVIGFYNIRKSFIAIVFALASLLLFDYVHKLFDVDIKPEDAMYRTVTFLRYIFAILFVYIVMIVYSLQKINTHYESIITNKNKQLSDKNVEINSQKEEIEAQRDEIEAQRDEVRIQRDEVIVQKEEIEHQKKEITDSIHYAQRIQQAVLPLQNELQEAVSDFFIFFKPRDIVSGDFYWINQIDNNIIIAVADCTGHGVPGAFMSMLGISYLNELVTSDNFENAGKTLDLMREKVKTSLRQTGKKAEQKDGMDIVLIAINIETKMLQYAGANNPLVLVRNNELSVIKPDRMPIGIHGREKPFTNNEVQLQKDDVIYAYSDGFQDQFGGEKGRKFLSKRFKNLLFDIHKNTLPEQHEILEKTLSQWQNPETSQNHYEQVDDILIVGIKI